MGIIKKKNYYLTMKCLENIDFDEKLSVEKMNEKTLGYLIT